MAIARLLSASLLLAVVGLGRTAFALSCAPPPPDPIRCFCDYAADVYYLGHIEVEEIPPNRRVISLRVEEVFASAGSEPLAEAGEALPISESASFVPYEEHTLEVDERRFLASSWDGHDHLWEEMVAADAPLTSYGFGLDDDQQTAEVCTTPVAVEDVARALVAEDCRATLRELAPQIPPKPAYRCEASGLFGCGSAGPGAPWLPGAALASLLVLLLRRRQKTRMPAKKLGKKCELQPGSTVTSLST